MANKPLDVIFFLPHLDCGGAEMNAVRLAAGLLEQKIKPVFVLSRGPGSYSKYLPNEVEVIVLPTGSIASSTVRLLLSLGPLARLIDSRKPSILCPVMPFPSIVALAAIRFCRHKPMVALSIQNTLEPPTQGRSNMVERFEHALIPRVFPFADRVIALSSGVAADVARAVPSLTGHIEVIYNVGLPLHNQLNTQMFENPKPRNIGRVRFLSCGRLVEQKGYPFLLEAFAQLSRSIDAELHILGEGPLRRDLEKMTVRLGIEERVVFLGFQHNPFVHMKAADVFVLSSLWEGFANVIVEAMAMGTPVIASDCPHGPSEIITHGENGILVEPGDSTALAMEMLRLARNQSLRESLVAAGIVRSKDFSAEIITSKYAELFYSMTEQKEEQTNTTSMR